MSLTFELSIKISWCKQGVIFWSTTESCFILIMRKIYFFEILNLATWEEGPSVVISSALDSGATIHFS